MAQYKTDLRDIYFNLFEVLKVQDRTQDYEANDLKDIIDQYDNFVGKEIFPTRIIGDEKGVKLANGKVTVPEEFKRAMEQYYANGWFGLGYPEDIGGMPAPFSIHFACVSLDVGANTALSMYPGLTRGSMNVILKIGSDEQKNIYVPPMMEGRWGGTMCLTEPGAGSDVGAVKTTATPIEGDKYKINGVKIFISSGDNDIYENIIHLVLARTPGAPEGTKGLSLFIVPKFKESGESNGVTCTKIEEKMGIHGSATCELTFDGNCEGWLIGKEFDGMANMFIMMNEARLLCGIQGESQGCLAYQLTEQYAKERVQFGTEIHKLPDVKRLLLRMRALSRGMKALVLYTADLFDQNEEDEIALLTPICKAYCSEEGFNIGVDAVQVHGGYGFCTEYGIEQFVRDTKIATIYEGTNAIQAIDFVMRKILKDQGKVFGKLAGKISGTMKLPEAGQWKSEVAALGESMQKAQEILTRYGKFAGENRVNSILFTTSDFLMYCGNIVIAWLLLRGACEASAQLAAATGDDKAYYESKIVDFQFFCQHILTRNKGIADSILSFDSDLSSIEI